MRRRHFLPLQAHLVLEKIGASASSRREYICSVKRFASIPAWNSAPAQCECHMFSVFSLENLAPWIAVWDREPELRRQVMLLSSRFEQAFTEGDGPMSIRSELGLGSRLLLTMALIPLAGCSISVQSPSTAQQSRQRLRRRQYTSSQETPAITTYRLPSTA